MDGKRSQEANMPDNSPSVHLDWQRLYQAAILETDWSKIQDRIQAADLAIEARLCVFAQDHGGTPEENQAIRDAVNGLTVLRREIAVWLSKR
jgi:hypothetical protein